LSVATGENERPKKTAKQGGPGSPAQLRSAAKSEAAEREIDILLVEDNPGDAQLTIEFLKDARLPFRVILAEDGEKAMTFLNELKGEEGKSRPSMVLLDIKIPKKDGFEVLHEIRGNKDLSSIPVIILTGSRLDEDRQKAMSLGADLYCLKPRDVKEWEKLTESIGHFWILRKSRPSDSNS
jgi:chemotaxis family two-component system response regulator Rcp1